MKFQVLGPVTARDRMSPVSLGGPLRRVLLGVLLARPNTEVPVDVLTDALWRGRPDARAPQKLQQHAHRLRHALDDPDRLAFGRAGYRLRVLPGELDAERFESLLDEPAGGARRDVLRSALALWRGEPFDGLDVPLLADRAFALTERRLLAAEELSAAELAAGRAAAVIGELSEVVRRHPLRERSHGLLITALYQAGRRADALSAYRDARATIVDQLGVEPGAELQRLEQWVLAGEPVTPEPRPSAVPAQLPHDVAGFVGRTAELSAMDGLDLRVAALTGTAGVGKTALAVHWAHRARARFPDGQLYVDLRGYGPGQPVPPHEVLARFLRALGVRGASVPTDPAERATRFRSALDGKRALLVLDNARSVSQVRPLLPGSPTCFVLVTSRDSLAGLVARDGARRVEVGRLGHGEAVQLLAGLAGTEPDAVRGLADHCSRLPLALRIAAESVHARSDWPGDRVDLDLLDAGGDPDTDIREVFSWSYRQLPSPAARLFRLLGLHPGAEMDPRALTEMAGAAPGQTARALETLERAHLVERVAGGRIGTHDLLRAYAGERAGEEAETERRAARRRLFGWYLRAAVAARRAMAPGAPAIPLDGRGPTAGEFPVSSPQQAVAWFEAERPTLVAVIRAAAEHGEHGIAWRIAAALLSLFNVTKYWDDWVAGFRTALGSARLAGDRFGEASVLNGLGVAYDDLGRWDEAISCHRRAARLFAETGDDHAAAWNLNNLGVAYDRMGRFDDSVAQHRMALALFRAAGDRTGESLSLNNLGDVLRQRRDFGEAADHLHRALELQLAARIRDGQRFTLCSLGDLHRDRGHTGLALDHYARALKVSREHGDRWQTTQLLARLADLHDRGGQRAEPVAG